MSDGEREGKKVGEGGKEGEISKEHKEEKGRRKGDEGVVKRDRR